MIPLLLALLQQVPALEEAAASPLPCKDPILIATSNAGKFVVIAEARKVHVLHAETLKVAHTLEFESTAVGFDPEDKTLTVVGNEVIRLDTQSWKETFRADLPDHQLRKAAELVRGIVVDLRRLEPPEGWIAGQAWVTAAGEIYFRSRDGNLSKAIEKEGKLTRDTIAESWGEHTVNRILGVMPAAVLVDLSGGAGVVLKGRAYALIGSSGPLAVGAAGKNVALVTRSTKNVYDAATWKVRSAMECQENRAAAFDSRRGWFFIARGNSVHAWDGQDPGAEHQLVESKEPISGLALDSGSKLLYAVQGEKVRAWRIKD